MSGKGQAEEASHQWVFKLLEATDKGSPLLWEVNSTSHIFITLEAVS